MSNEEEQYICLINEEGQYSIWFAWKDIPIGWKQVGITGSKKSCLDYIKEVWVDMRPKSLQKKIDEQVTLN